MSFLTKLLERPIAASMVVTSLSLLGIVSILRLPVGLLPNLSSPGITVLTRYPGVSSDSIERILTIPIERELREIPSIEKMMSSSNDGESRVHLVFYPDTNVDVRILDVREKLFQLEDRFPREVEPPSVLRYDPSDRPVFIVSFSSHGANNQSLKRLREIIEFQVKPRFERIRGVSEVFVGGGGEREIQVLIDPYRLVALHLFNEVTSSLDDGNQFIPSGRLENSRSLVYADSRLQSIEEIEKLFVPMQGAKNRRDSDRSEIPFSSFAEIVDSERPPTSISLSNGKERISLYINKAGDANTLSVTKRCEEELQIFSERYPEIQHHIVYNQGTQISDAISQVLSACISGIVLAVAVLHLFLRRGGFTLVIGIAIPASLLTTFFLMFLFDIELNVMSLSGLALGAGMLVDASIVVSEASAKALTQVSSKSTSALKAIDAGVTFVRGEVVASTLSTIIVFLPLLFADYETRAMYRDFTLTVSFSLLTSMAFSLSVLPVFLVQATRYSGTHKMKKYQILISLNHLFSSIRNYVQLKVSGLFHQSKMFRLVDNELWIELYTKAGAQKGWVIFSLLTFIFSAPILFLFIEKEYMAKTDSDVIEATIDLDPGIHLEKTREIVQIIEEELLDYPAIEEINSKIENSHATLTIKVTRDSNTEHIIDDLQAITDGNSDAYVHYERSSEGSGSDELEVEFFGEDIGAMKHFAKMFSQQIQRKFDNVDRVILRFRDGRQDFVLYPYSVKNEIQGINTAIVGQSLRQLMQGNVITKYYDSTQGTEREVDIRVKATDGFISTPEDIVDLQLPIASGPLKILMQPIYEENETQIFRKNRRRSISILVQFQSISTENLANKLQELIDEATLPPETVVAFGDAYERMLTNQRQMTNSLIFSFILVYLLLAFLFEDFFDPIIVMTSIPISLSFVFMLLIVIGRSLNMSIYIGLIMLGGIVVNNAILILSQIRADERNLNDFYDFIKVSFLRLRAILMTTTTTVLGMTPLLFDTGSQSALWNSLAITVTSGLLFSMPAILFIIPFIAYIQKSIRR